MMSQDNRQHPFECKCFTWKPIFAGALVAIGLTFLLNLFSVAIGLTAFSVNEGTETLVLGGLIGTAIGIVAVMFVSGWVAGYLGNRYCNKHHLGALYGFLTWCLALIFAVFLAGHLQHYVTFYSGAISGHGVDMTMASNVAAANVTAVKAAAMKTAAVAPAAKVAVAAEAPMKAIAISAYIIFALFFLSAFASSLGGHCGMCHRCKENHTC